MKAKLGVYLTREVIKMLAKVLSFGLIGIEAYPVEIEIDVSNGLPAINLVGLLDASVKESKERVKSAIKNSGFKWPGERITINLAPSDIRKEGSCFDLAIALGILSATCQINSERLQNYYILGELSLDGAVRPTKGILPISIALSKSKIKNIILPSDNSKEASIVSDICVWPIKTLRQAVELLNSPEMFTPFKCDLQEILKNNYRYQVDFSEVKGQYYAKRALEVAVSGGHNILMTWTQYC